MTCIKKWSLMVTMVLLFSLLLTPFSQALAQGKTAPGRQVNVKVMTYNIHTGIGTDGDYNIDRIANTIQQSGADIIGLQEVDVNWSDRSNFQNELKRLAEKLDMHYFFAPIYNRDPIQPDDPRRKFGVAILSKHPILQADNHEITRLSTQDPHPEPKPSPGFAEALINVKGAKLWFYVTHLDYRSEPIVRQMQVEDMLNVMQAHNNKILVGDMNATPKADELQPLFQRFKDTWDITQQDEGLTYPAYAPTKKIDYILTTPDMDVQSTDVIQTMASDHLPVTADVTLTRGR
ncbi:endonuclease/exonuclease/phosphatase family protein [Tuberibacillus sp. Marseille-P3662]|uniref:endonuclease/exonuclease/phosphatase family protein n=1 Tax=Tuberibacillus sp. Marseille-P3662 TaxID=1965358 RepID=UPI0020CB38CA|nr:endonuclease/exonuclease/phosphatase family protein [Tuberibacillus sp. Marseille-P3662]